MASRESSEEIVKKIYSDLKAQILTGQLKPKHKLTETRIAEQFGVSRLHVKSAFRLLAVESLVYHIEMKGYFVAENTDDLLEEIMAIRQALESIVIQRVIQIATKENIDQLENLNKRVKVFFENNMIDDGLKEVDSLYDYLYTVCNYKRVTSILEKYSEYISLIRHKSATTLEQHLDYQRNLDSMIQAIAGRNVEKAICQVQQRHKYLQLAIEKEEAN